MSGPVTPSLIVMLCNFNVHCEADNFMLSKSNSNPWSTFFFFFLNRDYMGNNADNKSGVLIQDNKTETPCPFFSHTETDHIME